MPIFNANTIGWFNPPEDGKPVRHVHPPNSKNWHDAHESHGTNPGSPSDPHVIYNVYDQGIIRWGEKNRYITNAIKNQLVKDAKLAYENGTIGPRYDLPQAPPSTPESSSTSSADPDVIARIEAIEDVMLGTAQSVNDHDKAIEALKSNTNGSSSSPLIDKAIADLSNENKAIRTELEEVKANQPQRFEIRDPKTNNIRILEGIFHKDYNDILHSIRKLDITRRQAWIAGPAGCGKSFMVKQIAKALGLNYESYGAITDEIKLLGYVGIDGKFIETVFYKFYKYGGVLLLDECDASIPEVLILINMALANGQMMFPLDAFGNGGTTFRHKDFYCFATANTMGDGADSIYSARAKIDGATLDRFITVDMDYDPRLEKLMIEDYAHEWVTVVQAVRQAAKDAEADFIISPRSSEFGMDLLRDDGEDNPPVSRELVVRRVFGRYMKHELWPHIGKAAIEWARRSPDRPRNFNGSNLNSVDFTR